MNTPSHFLMTAAARRAAPTLQIPRSAVWLGSVAPDIPLYLLFMLGLFWFRTIEGMAFADIWTHMWAPQGLYFTNSWWKGLHSLFHAPLVILAGLAFGCLIRRRSTDAGRWILWFFAACLLHCVVDVFTHNDDGPLLFWPLNWDVRFSSPVSYWDPDHYGRIFSVFEIVFDVLLSGYLVWPWLTSKSRLNQVSGARSEESG